MAKNRDTQSASGTEEIDPNAVALDPNTPIVVDETGMVEEAVGFPPYWQPAPGKKFYGTPILCDTSNPEFVRWTLEAAVDHVCTRGKKDEGDHVLVKKGEWFSVSEYSGLPLFRFIGKKILVTAESTRKLAQGRTLWEFSVRVDQKTKALLESERADSARRAVERQLAGNNPSSRIVNATGQPSAPALPSST